MVYQLYTRFHHKKKIIKFFGNFDRKNVTRPVSCRVASLNPPLSMCVLFKHAVKMKRIKFLSSSDLPYLTSINV